jgi:NADH-quinone oxidoreductase subunit C/D
MASEAPVKPQSSIEVPDELKHNVFVNTIDNIYSWGWKNSLWPLTFGLACCAIEFITTAASRYDIDRFGAGLARATPRQADVMYVSGTVTKKMVPSIVRIYNQMPEPKFVISMGACATGGGPFKEGYNVVSGIDKYIPVDVYVPGCPPTPQALLNGLIKLQEKIARQGVSGAPWYRKDERNEPIPVPILGPDIIDPRDLPRIKTELERKRHEAEQAPDVEAEDDSSPKPRPKRVAKPPKLPEWDTTPTEEIQALASRVNAALGEGTVTPEKDTLVVEPSKLLEFGRYLRDDADLDYSFLSNVTGVDYMGREPRFEVVYHAYSIARGGGPLVFKTRAAEADPEVPSLTSIWPGANFQEREVYDLFGVRFAGHPNLKRILMWEGFYGHPMRKDYNEAYYEEDLKPFTSRWPGGYHARAETQTSFGKNVVYPEDWDPDAWVPDEEALEVVDAKDVAANGGLDTEQIMVNIGPQHPSTHGVFRMVVTLEGERVVNLEPVLGYLHRNHEKIGERNGWLMNMPYTDRLDYVAAMANNLGYALAVEKLMKVEIPERAEYLRIIMAEFARIVNHFWLVGFLLNDLGAFFTPALYAIREREYILDLYEEASGSRMMVNYMRFGGVAYDVSDDWLDRARFLVTERLPRAVDQLETLLSDNEILVARTRDVGVLTAEEAIAYSLSGPMLRASGAKYDIRRAEPYGIYDRFDFDIPTGQNGDVYDRYLIRIQEIRQSLRILKQALDQIQPGEILGGRKAYAVRVPAGEAYARIEQPKGELGYYVVSNGSGNPWRYRVRSPGFVNLTALSKMARGHIIADAIVILGAIDIVLGEVDR